MKSCFDALQVGDELVIVRTRYQVMKKPDIDGLIMLARFTVDGLRPGYAVSPGTYNIVNKIMKKLS